MFSEAQSAIEQIKKDYDKLEEKVTILTSIVEFMHKEMEVKKSNKREREEQAEEGEVRRPREDSHRAVHITNFDKDMDPETLRHYFSVYGTVDRIYVHPMGWGVVTFETQKAAEDCLATWNRRHNINVRRYFEKRRR